MGMAQMCKKCGVSPAYHNGLCKKCDDWRTLDHPAPTEVGNYYLDRDIVKVRFFTGVYGVWTENGFKPVSEIDGCWSGRIPDALPGREEE